MHANRTLLLAALGLLAGIGVLLFVGIRNGPEPGLGEPATAGTVATQETDPLEASGSDLFSESRTSVDPTVPNSSPPGDRAPASVDPRPSAAPGRLRVRGIDAETGLPVDRVRVRAISETRFADRHSDRDGDRVDLVLSPGTYSILVLAKGYEGSELPSQSIVSGKTTSLESVPLHGGSARVLGAVTGDTWAADTLWVELVGDGRRPCPACVDVPSPASKQPPTHGQRWSKADYCSRCGYAKPSSRLAVPPDGRFEFEHLTSGPYAVRLMDVEERTLCDPKFFELEIGQSFPIEIRFAAPRRVRIEIVDTDGTSLAPEWAARRRRDAAADEDEPAKIVHAVQPVDFDCRFRTEHLQIGSSTFTPPLLEPNVALLLGPAAFGARKLGAGARHDRDDRPRERGDELRPELPPANVSLGYFPSVVDHNGIVRFDSVPSLELTLTMTSGPFTATTAIPASPDEPLLQVTLHLAENIKKSTTKSGSGDTPTLREYELQRMK